MLHADAISMDHEYEPTKMFGIPAPNTVIFNKMLTKMRIGLP